MRCHDREDLFGIFKLPQAQAQTQTQTQTQTQAQAQAQTLAAYLGIHGTGML